MSQYIGGFNRVQELIGMREMLHTFQTRAGLVGPIRSQVLEKCLSAAIAYAAPCFVGDVDDGMGYYRNSVQGNAMKLISQVNEICIVSADKVLADVERLWLHRYNTINNPIECHEHRRFYAEMEGGDNITGHYELWVRKFLTATFAEWTRLTGGE